MSHNYNMRYDWRNLLIYIWHWNFKAEDISDNPKVNVFMSQYWYDEAGNRIRKEKYQWILTGGSPDLEYTGQAEPVGEEESGSWVFVEATNYIRDIAGREIAIYSSNTLQQWNMYGLDNVGNIKANGDKLYYLKDHLGTVRAVLDTTNTVVAAYDYDPWGYPLSNRTYEASSSVDQKYKFTSKQRDKESGVNGNNGYDYFGARYYDSRIGRWGGVEPLLDKYVGVTPYCYSLNNPLIILDIDGKDPVRSQLGTLSQVKEILEQNAGKTFYELSNVFKEGNVRYIATENSGFIDLRHFFAAASSTQLVGKNGALWLGEQNELFQDLTGDISKYDPEDLHSNLKGAEFSEQYGTQNVAENFDNFIEQLGGSIDPTDLRIAEANLYIPNDENEVLSNPLPERKPEISFFGKRTFNYNAFFGVKSKNNHEELGSFGGQ